jgi:gelsolin
VHFWLGKDSSQDEIGVAAYKTVELDALLDDGPVQHRETQGFESKLFLSYFKELNYKLGGLESGFRKVKAVEYKPRLLMVRQLGITKSFEVPCEASSLNHGDCFVLDCGLDVYLWHGEESSAMERMKSGVLQHNIVSARSGKARKAPLGDAFWEALGGDMSMVRSADDPLVADEMHKPGKLDAGSIKLWRISDASGKCLFTLEDEGAVSYDRLDSGDVFLVHSNISIWVWLGALATAQEKSMSMKFADQYIRDNDLPSTVTVTAIKEEAARTSASFQALFRG